MEPSPQFWEKVAPRIEQRLDVWKRKSFEELAALSESSSDGEEEIEGRRVSYSAMCCHRDAENVILLIRASIQVGWVRGRDYESGFVMSPQGQVRAATEEELRSLW